LPKAYYSRVKEFGENVWASDKYPADVNASIPIMAWYDQVQMFNWSNNIFNFSTVISDAFDKELYISRKNQ
jgi:hypothetical protein